MRALVALDIDGTLIDTTPSFTRIVKELSGATDEDIRRFRGLGGFNDDWELARACVCWIGAGRPDILEQLEDVEDVVRRCGHDPGDLAARGVELYRGGYWKDERVLVEGALLHAVSARARVAACTGRDLWELDKAQELLGFTFAERTTMEDVKKPDPRALLRLARDDDEVIFLLGDTAADRQCAERARATSGRRVSFYAVSPERPARPFLTALAAGAPLAALAARCEGVDQSAGAAFSPDDEPA
jgi:phosphoglycolate phosphatase-like HAD superfamily hydrolase